MTPTELAEVRAIAQGNQGGVPYPHPTWIKRFMSLGDSTSLDQLYASGGAAYRSLMVASANTDGIPIAFVGHVITGPNLNYNGGLNTVLGNYLKTDTGVFAGPVIQHEGINGYSLVGSYSGGTNANSLATILTQRQPVADLLPEVIIFLAGYNDTVVFGASGATADWGTAAGLVVDQVHAQAPTARIFWCNMAKVGPVGSVSSGGYNDAVNFLPYRNRIATAAQDSSRAGYVTYIDLSAIVGWDPTVDTRDGLHPSPQGYSKINTYAWPLIKPYVA